MKDEIQIDFKLRPWSFNDLDSVTKSADNINITSNMSDGFPRCKEQWKSFIEFAINNKFILYLAIEIDGQAVGGIGVSVLKEPMNHNAELGYWLNEAYWGKGIMTKAVKEIVELAFNTFDLMRIFATPYENNVASHRLLEKAGFKFEARLEKVVNKKSQLIDELVYSIRRNDLFVI